MRRFVLALAVGCLAATTAAADVDIETKLGHGGRWVEGAATPVVVQLESSGDEQVEVSLHVGQGEMLGAASVQHQRTVFLGPRASRREVFLIPGPWYGGTVTLDVETSPPVTLHYGRETATKGRKRIRIRGGRATDSPSLHFASRVVGTVNDRRGVIAARLPLATEKNLIDIQMEHGRVGAMSVSPRDLRHAPFSLDGLDTLLVCDPDASFLGTPAELDAVLDWVALGGHLVVSLGDDAAAFAASPLAASMPARWTGVDRANYRPVLHHLLALNDEEIEFVAPREGPWAELEPRNDATDRLRRRGDLGVLHATRRYGSGRITLLPFDVRMATEVLQDPAQITKLTDLLVERYLPKTPGNDPAQLLSQMANQLNLQTSVAAVLRQKAFEPPPLVLVILGLVMYVLVVGPVDWFILKRLKKERLTTITFAAAVTGFTVLAYGASMLLFASDAVVNRIVLLDLADGERDGRELVRATDLAGFYAPTGGDRTLEYPLPALTMGGGLPGVFQAGDVGDAMPLIVGGTDPLRPKSVAQVSFRSQRAVRAMIAGPTGRSVDVECDGTPGVAPVTVTNGLPVTLEGAWVITREGGYMFDTIEPGETKTAVFHKAASPGREWLANARELNKPSRDEVFELFGALSHGQWLSRQAARGMSGNPFQRISATEMVVLGKTGIDRSHALLRGNALFLAHANESPLPLPGADEEGRTYVIVRKEVPLR